MAAGQTRSISTDTSLSLASQLPQGSPQVCKIPVSSHCTPRAHAATRSSPRLSAWLENHRLFGPILSNWRNGKIIARKAKVSATVSMLLCATLMLVMLDHGWAVYLAIAGMSLGNLWIWSRPETMPSS
jgi:uncharacterized membrane protein YbaN (DUF454 family)